MMHLGIWAVLPTAILGFLVGGLWYGPLFGKAWAAARGLGDELKQGANMPLIFGLTLLLNLVSAAVLNHVLQTYGAPDIGLALMIAGGIAAGFILPAMGVNYLLAPAVAAVPDRCGLLARHLSADGADAGAVALGLIDIRSKPGNFSLQSHHLGPTLTMKLRSP